MKSWYALSTVHAISFLHNIIMNNFAQLCICMCLFYCYGDELLTGNDKSLALKHYSGSIVLCLI